jgi:hypothetical protein
MRQMGQRSPIRKTPPESLFHWVLKTVLYHPKKERGAITRLYCVDCERVFFDGIVKTREDRRLFKMAEATSIDHRLSRGHEVVYVRPERLL